MKLFGILLALFSIQNANALCSDLVNAVLKEYGTSEQEISNGKNRNVSVKFHDEQNFEVFENPPKPPRSAHLYVGLRPGCTFHMLWDKDKTANTLGESRPIYTSIECREKLTKKEKPGATPTLLKLCGENSPFTSDQYYFTPKMERSRPTSPIAPGTSGSQPDSTVAKPEGANS